MTEFDPITLARRRFLSYGVTADEYAEAVLDLNTSLAADVLATPGLKRGTELRTRLAMQDTRLAFDALIRILTIIAQTEEQRENLTFLLAKTIDDSLNLGAFYMVGRAEAELPLPITAADFASNGGKRRAEKDAKTKQPVKERFAQICANLMLEDPQRLASQLIKAAKKMWGEATPVLPESKQLSTWLEEAVSAGTVPAPRTDRRSKKVRKSAG